MAKPRTPNQKKKYAALNKRLAKYVSMVQDVYDQYAEEYARLAVESGFTDDAKKPFRFNDYPKMRKKVKDLQAFFIRDIHGIIITSTSKEWEESNLVQNLLANDVLKTYGVKRRGEKHKVYYQTNINALKAFQNRKDGGLTISQKVWNQSDNMVREMEYCISSAIEKGTSAVKLSKRLSKYLHDFPSLQKDYKQKYGQSVDCQNCEYRSVRLARSEINMAYRSAEQERWRQMDFIKGYEIKTSGAHPKKDICDDLAGIYPKSFKWLGWHPNCMCYCVPIIMTDDEYYGGRMDEIEEMPEQFNEWMESNEERVEKLTEERKLPYWLQDNEIRDNKIFLTAQSDREEFRNRQKYTREKYREESKMRDDGKRYYTKHMIMGLKDFDSLVSHCNDTEELAVVTNIKEYIGKLSGGKYIPIDMSRPNYNKKIKDRVIHFTSYDIDVNGQAYVLKCAAKRNKFSKHDKLREHPYSLKKKRGE